MSLEKITSYTIDEINKSIELYLVNNPTPVIPSLSELDFEIFKALLINHNSPNINRVYDGTINQIMIVASVDSNYIKGYNIYYVPNENQYTYNITINDINTSTHTIDIQNHLVFLALSETLALMPLK